MEETKIVQIELSREEKIDDLISMHDDIKSMIELQKDILGALRVFVIIGNAVKWVGGTAAAVGSAYYIFRTGSHK